jgi:type II secretory pathway component GspD/PulD (secretin)
MPFNQSKSPRITPRYQRIEYLARLLCSFLALSLLLLPVVLAASITTIQLQNRPAEEIIPIVKPLLGPGEVITASGFKLFLRASPASVEQVRDIVDALDIATKMLQISVFQGSERDLTTVAISGNLRIERGDASVGAGVGAGVGSSGKQAAGNIAYDSGNVSGDINANSSQTSKASNPVHQLRVSEGTEGFIQTGSQIAYSSYNNGTEYKDVTTGFYVLPRIRGHGVTLKVRPFKNSLSNTRAGNIETQSANTTISGRLGEWLPLGGVTEQFKRSQSSIGSSSSVEGSNKSSIWIRADLIQ